eukprot:ctg_172.g93
MLKLTATWNSKTKSAWRSASTSRTACSRKSRCSCRSTGAHTVDNGTSTTACAPQRCRRPPPPNACASCRCQNHSTGTGSRDTHICGNACTSRTSHSGARGGSGTCGGKSVLYALRFPTRSSSTMSCPRGREHARSGKCSRCRSHSNS